MSGNKFIKYLNISLWVMFAISVILIFFVVKNSDGTAMQLDGLLDTNFYWAYFLFFVALTGIVLFSVYQMVTVKGDRKKTMIALAAFVAIFIIAYLMSSTEIPQFYGAKAMIAEGSLTPKTAQMVDTGLYASYILAFISVAALLYSSLSKFWSK